jgi:hypothetical protein
MNWAHLDHRPIAGHHTRDYALSTLLFEHAIQEWTNVWTQEQVKDLVARSQLRFFDSDTDGNCMYSAMHLACRGTELDPSRLRLYKTSVYHQLKDLVNSALSQVPTNEDPAFLRMIQTCQMQTPGIFEYYQHVTLDEFQDHSMGYIQELLLLSELLNVNLLLCSWDNNRTCFDFWTFATQPSRPFVALLIGRNSDGSAYHVYNFMGCINDLVRRSFHVRVQVRRSHGRRICHLVPTGPA